MAHLEKKNYTKHYRGYSDNVTEYVLNSNKSLSLSEFEKLLKDQEAYLCGWIEFAKKRLTYSSGKIVFKHICIVAMSVD